MKYQSGSIGRAIVARFEDGEDFLQSIQDLAKDEGIRSAVFFLVGGVRKGRMVLGPKGGEMPPEPVWDEISGNSEMLGTGTIFWDGETPKAHLHTAVGRGEKVRAGCLREQAGTFLVLEAVVLEIKGVNARRGLDPVSGLSLLTL